MKEHTKGDISPSVAAHFAVPSESELRMCPSSSASVNPNLFIEDRTGVRDWRRQNEKVGPLVICRPSLTKMFVLYEVLPSPQTPRSIRLGMFSQFLPLGERGCNQRCILVRSAEKYATDLIPCYNIELYQLFICLHYKSICGDALDNNPSQRPLTRPKGPAPECLPTVSRPREPHKPPGDQHPRSYTNRAGQRMHFNQEFA